MVIYARLEGRVITQEETAKPATAQERKIFRNQKPESSIYRKM